MSYSTVGNRFEAGAGAGASASSDPFAVGMDALTQSVNGLNNLHRRWQQLLSSTNTKRSADFRVADEELKRKLKRADEDLTLLEKTVKLVESQRQRFEHIDDDEIASRHRQLRDKKAALQLIGGDLFSSATRRKIEQDERDHQRAIDAEAAQRGVSRGVVANDHFLRGEQQTQEMMVRQQDEQLDVLSQGVGRLGDMASTIGNEVEEQSKMLSEMDEDLDRAAEKMGLVLGKVAKLLKTKDKCQIWGVLLLFFTLVILVALVIYT